jgi:hypothetical protein
MLPGSMRAYKVLVLRDAGSLVSFIGRLEMYSGDIQDLAAFDHLLPAVRISTRSIE